MEYLMEVIGALLFIISTYIGITVSSVKRKTDSIDIHVGEINGSVRELKVWAKMHEKLDEERFANVRGTETIKG